MRLPGTTMEKRMKLHSDGNVEMNQVPPNLDPTPACPQCGDSDNWKIERENRETATWDRSTQSLKYRTCECWQMTVYCGACGCEDLDFDHPFHNLIEGA